MTNEIAHPCRHGQESVLCLQCHRAEIELLRAALKVAPDPVVVTVDRATVQSVGAQP